MTPDHSDDRAFDEAMRQRHATAVARISARTRAQLQQRRRAALAPSRPASAGLRRYGWAGATAIAALLAIAVGVPWQRDALTASAPTAGVATIDAGDAIDAEDDTVLDENPDFYLWLGSADAQTLAME